MNKLFLAFIFLASAFLFAQEEQGVHANVELVTGAKQGASFLGIKQDTVNLGGIIQGKFVVVKIHKSRFKSIVDDQGNDLLNAVPDTSATTAADTTVADTTATQIDSSVVNVPDSVQTDSTAIDSTAKDSANTTGNLPPKQGTVPEEFKQEHVPCFLDSVEGKHVFVALERRSIDSALAAELTHIATRLLQEQGTPIVYAKRTDFGYCRDQGCIRDSLAAYGATSAFQGSISAAKAQDSVSVLMTHTTFGDSARKVSNTAQMNLSTFTAMSDAIAEDKLNNFLKKLQGKPIPVVDKSRYIHVETDPEGANLEIEGEETLCKTPCTIATRDTGKVVLYAYWNVDRHIWAARSTVATIPGDTSKVSLKLRLSKPELFITSNPDGAEIYPGSAPVSITTKSIGRTPNKYAVFEPGLSTVQLRKAGFRDTLVNVYVTPTGITNLDVQMEPISDPAEILRQQEWLHEKKKDFVGKTLMGTAAAPILLGALFTYLAHDDYDEASKIKDQLNIPASSEGENYKSLVKKNHDKAKSGDRKMIIGGSLIGTGIILFGIGFTLSF